MGNAQGHCSCCQQDGTEPFAELDQIIDRYRNKDGNLIQILHIAQELYGHLSLELQQHIAGALNKPLSEISGVVTFYSFFSTKPRGEHTIRVCLGTACYVRGGKKIVDALHKTLNVEIGETTADGKFTFEVARCIGACGLAPAMLIDDVVYKQVNINKLDAILSRY
jgi:NADH:ubiquinone oxidoreductase subunit E